ncbi:DEAD/DEAH box helicase [Rhodomicrobium vannielii ATCC 17100]|nr:DEAD/DEAH box helicase [Rhodomicrobium vannielii ATCC 17100]
MGNATPFALTTKLLRQSRTPTNFDLYKAALEWSLVDPIIINSREDLKSESRWKSQGLEPYHHQVTNLINFCRRLPVTLLADDVGLGKTISAGLVASELISRKRISRLFIVCPKLLGPQWKEELETKFDIPAEVVIGNKLVDAEPHDDIGAIITTYNSARLYIGRIPSDRFQMLVLDEAHKLRNLYGTPAPPQVAKCFRKVLEDRMFKYVLMLTATPIQNRLWDLYSLVDLLTVARGHENPFGGPGLFVRNFIADGPQTARQLRPDAKDRFRSIVYGYMSRVPRADANLQFPERSVLLHRVPPTPPELELIRLISKPIQSLNRLAQISILQALTSSPDALAAQLENMARKGTIPQGLAVNVRAHVKQMPRSAKLSGLAGLVSQLSAEKSKDWRMVVFTGRRETQTIIEAFLQAQGIRVGIINGSTTGRNQETIANLKANPPKINVIVSTEAGSEGVNLQAANVLVNYDLPWNPMIVEQRIGRVQRLASQHARVFVYSVTLAGTFEEYIVGRLMEKLQMAAHAIGDVEALLEATGMNDSDDAEGFEEQIRKLVVDSLAGIDVKAATRLAEESIAKARTTLIEEEERINALLGGMGDARDIGPRAPNLPPQDRSLDAKTLVLRGLESLGGQLREEGPEKYMCNLEGRTEHISLDEGPDDLVAPRTVSYTAGSVAFDRLVSRLTQGGIHNIQDRSADYRQRLNTLSRSWVETFAGIWKGYQIQEAVQKFVGNALVQVRATVAHDSYERLISVECSPDVHRTSITSSEQSPSLAVIEQPQAVGIDTAALAQAVKRDAAISEFCRFYIERRDEEVAAAGEDSRKKRKMEEDFTPRLEASLVGLQGSTAREVKIGVRYTLEHDEAYESSLQIDLADGSIAGAPKLGRCSVTQMKVPADCLKRCAISGKTAIRHHLRFSEISKRMALPEHTVVCELTGKSVLSDEAETSDVTGKLINIRSLKTSEISGKRAETDLFGRCAFTKVDALKNELATSEASGKPYRADEQSKSAVSGKTGHRSEFSRCEQTGAILLPTEGEQCAVTGKLVIPGLLATCAVSGKKVLPAQLGTSAASGKKALSHYLVSSSISGARMLEDEAIRSLAGAYCLPAEAKPCLWGGKFYHPDDLRKCSLTGVPIHVGFATVDRGFPHLQALADILSGTEKTEQGKAMWPLVAEAGAKDHRGKWHIESAKFSPDERHLAVCAEIKTWLGLRSEYAGLIYSLDNKSLVGHIAIGKRKGHQWLPASQL